MDHMVGLRRLLRNVGAGWARLVVEIGVGFVLTPFIIGSLGMASYGIWSLLNNVVGYLGLVDLGIRGSVGRYINHYMARRDAERTNEVVVTALVFLTAMSIVALVVALLLGRYFQVVFPKTPDALTHPIAVALPLLAVGLWLTLVTAVFTQLAVAKDRFDIVHAVNVLQVLLRAGAVVFVLRSGWGFLGLAVALVATNLLGAVLHGWIGLALNPEIRPALRWLSRERLREVWRFGVVTFFTRAANQLIYQADGIVVMVFFGPAAVGIYSVATTILQYGQNLVEQVGSSLYPSVTKAGSLRDYEGLAKSFLLQARLGFAIAVLVYAGLIVFGRAFLDLWVGPEYHQAATVLILLSLAELGSLFCSSGGSALFSLDLLRFNLLSALAEGFLNLALSVGFVLGPLPRLDGVALGTMVAAVAVRGIAHPLYTLPRIGLRAGSYFATVGSRVGLLFAVILALFWAISRAGPIAGWASFSAHVTVAALMYAPIAALILFGRGTIRTMWERASFAVRGSKP